MIIPHLALSTYLVLIMNLSIPAADRPLTAEPVDTMNLGDIPNKPSREKRTPSQQEEEVDRTELKLLLFPGQVSKIASLIALMAQQRDLCERLQSHVDMGSGDVTQSFTWLSQLKYDFITGDVEVPIKVREFVRNF